MELGLDPPDLPMGMLTDIHLRRCKAWCTKIFVDPFFAIMISTCELYYFASSRRRGIVGVC